MSQYQPPPLDSYDPQSAGAKRPPFAPALTAQHQPLLNPFGSPLSPPPPSLRTEGASLDDLAVQQKLRTDDRPVVAFISGIASEIDDSRFLEILQACGKVNSWRRAFDSDDNPLTFGFCEFKSLEGVVCAFSVLPRAAWTGQGQGECARSSPQPKPLTVTVDRTMQRMLDSHLSGAGPTPGVDKASEQAVLDAVTRIIQEPRALPEAGAEIRPVNRESTETETGAGAMVGGSSSHAFDGNTEFNLDTLTITKEIARHRLDSLEEGRQPESLERQQPLPLGSEEDWEREQTLIHRTRRYILAANDRESRLGKDLVERERRAETAALRELDRVEEMQRSRDSMSATLSKWDDSEEERLREHEYYRDRERWWHHRKAVRARELELDAIDQQEQTLGQRDKASSSPTGAKGPELADIGQGQSNTNDAAVRSARDGCLTGQTASEASDLSASAVGSLFAQSIEWDCVDEGFLRAKVEPAARGLLREYIGEGADQEATDLAEFVIGHIRDRKSPQSLVKELEIVLVEEAQAFVGQLWRLLPSNSNK